MRDGKFMGYSCPPRNLKAVFCSGFTLLVAATQTIFAVGVVASNTDADLRAAMTGGGLVTFTFDGKITLTNTLIITNDTTIDGTGHSITISGGGSVLVLNVPTAGVKLVLKRLTVADGGGGLFNNGDAEVSECTFSNNFALDGGAIDHKGSRMVITSSTFIQNEAIYGGAVNCGNENHTVVAGNLRITNCTFYANVAHYGAEGGAMSFIQPLASPAYVINCTFAWNTNGVRVNAYAPNPGAAVTFFNCIFANSGGSGNGAGIVDGGYSLSTDQSLTNTTSLINTDPQLGPLTNNGGFTLTILPAPGSPAIDGGDNNATPLTDQRGVSRPNGVYPDIGAVESTVAGTNTGILGFTVVSNNVTESNGLFTLTVVRLGGVAGTVLVNFATSNLTAVVGQDFVNTNGMLTFTPGLRSRSFSVQLLDDGQVDPTKTFAVWLSSATGGATIGRPASYVTIADNEVGLSFSSADFSVSEAGTNATITVIRTGPATSAISVNFATSDGTAVAGQNYISTNGLLALSSGQTNATFKVKILDNTLFESNKTVMLILSNATGGAALISPSAATLTILENDVAQPGTLQFGSAAYSIVEDSGQAFIKVVRLSGSNVPVTVHYATSNGTAVAGEDYADISGILTFNVGETMKYFLVPIFANPPGEGSETVGLLLSAPTGGAGLGSPSSALLTIVDGSQTLASCDDGTLRAAMSAGGKVIWPCDGIIHLSSQIIVNNSVILDATGHNLTLSGDNITRLFVVNPGVTLDLRNLTLADGFIVGSTGNDGSGGGILNNGGQVLLSGCNLLRNTAQGGDSPLGGTGGAGLGGAILNDGGFVLASNLTFSANKAIGGKGVSRSGVAYGGAFYQNGGVSYLCNCRFEGNSVSSLIPVGFPSDAGSVCGGAVAQSNGVMFVTDCDFRTNSAFGGQSSGRSGLAGAGRGGAIFSAAPLTIQDSLFAWNIANGGSGGFTGANGEGGALFLTQPALIRSSVFMSNSVDGGSPNPPFGSAGGAGRGGSIFNAGSLVLVNSAIAYGLAHGDDGYPDDTLGGAGLGGGLFNAGSLNATNVTFSGNQACGGKGGLVLSGGNGGGGAIFNNGGNAQIAYGTFADNAAVGGTGPGGLYGTNGVSLGGGILNTNGTVMLINTIIANSPSGSNALGTITDLGHNISSDASCSFSAQGSLNNTDPKLGPLFDNGGSTLTMALLPNSPAIGAALTITGVEADQRGVTRPYGAAPDIGAYEFTAPALQLSLPEFTNGLCLVRAAGSNGVVVRLQKSSDLSNWVDVFTNTTDNFGSATLQDPQPSVTLRFYRIVSP